MRLQILRILFIVGAVVCVYLGYDWWEQASNAQIQLAEQVSQLERIRGQVVRFQAMPGGKPLQPREEALENLIVRLIDESDLLGSSVRIEVPKEGIVWQPVEYGVEKAMLSVTTATEETNALAYFAMLWTILQEQPVHVTKATISRNTEVVKFELDLEVYSYGGEG